MSIIRQVLIQHIRGQSKYSIVRDLGLAKATVDKYLRAIQADERGHEALLKLPDSELSQVIYGDKESSVCTRLKHLQDRFPAMEKRLSEVGMTRQYLWESYRKELPGGYAYSQFCMHFNRYLGQSKPVMHLEHKAGDKMFVDYAGKKLRVKSCFSDEYLDFEVFISILGASQYIYAEASPSQKLPDFINANANALAYYGGVPRGIAVDNLKSAIKRSCKYEATPNEAFSRFCNHYQTSALATRPYRPRDKALVENAVRLIYQWIYTRLGEERFVGLADVNKRIRELLDEVNDRLFQKRDYSRRDRFEQIDKDVLSPLPQEAFELKHYGRAKVQQNGHVLLGEDSHYYSVPYRYIGERCRLNYTARTVEVFLKGERIATHKRDPKRYGYTTRQEHLASHHQYVMRWNPELFMDQALMLGPDVLALVEGILDQSMHPEQGYKSCQGVLALKKRYGAERLNQACFRAVMYRRFSYGVVRNILEKSLDLEAEGPVLSQPHIPEHDNIRGSEYYQ